MSFIPIIEVVSWLLCPIAILFGLIALRRPSKSLAIAGIVTGAVGLFICIQWIQGTKSVGDAMNADTFNTTGETKDLSKAPILDASISGLWKEIEDNKVAAGQKYGDHRLRFRTRRSGISVVTWKILQSNSSARAIITSISSCQPRSQKKRDKKSLRSKRRTRSHSYVATSVRRMEKDFR